PEEVVLGRFQERSELLDLLSVADPARAAPERQAQDFGSGPRFEECARDGDDFRNAVRDFELRDPARGDLRRFEAWMSRDSSHGSIFAAAASRGSRNRPTPHHICKKRSAFTSNPLL